MSHCSKTVLIVFVKKTVFKVRNTRAGLKAQERKLKRNKPTILRNEVPFADKLPEQVVRI